MISNSLVIPVYRNAENIPSLNAALEELAKTLSGNLEVLFVIDGSPDNSGELILQAARGFNSRVIFHSRNFGSFTAIRTGIEFASGQFVAAMAADLQEPPELIVEFFDLLARDVADVIFGQRVSRSDPKLKKLLSHAYWSVYRRFILPAMPRGGVDIFACNRQVMQTILAIEEPNSSLVAQLFWVGFRRHFVPYHRRARTAGKSAWGMSRRFRYMLDSVFSYTDLPIVLVLVIGAVGILFSAAFGTVTALGWLFGKVKEPGYTSLVILITFFGSLSLMVQGILGSYLWRALENTKKRPLRVISRIVQGSRLP